MRARERGRGGVLLGAWLLMAPPLPDVKSLEDVVVPTPAWTRIRSFATAMQCEAARLATATAARAGGDAGAGWIADRSRCLHARGLWTGPAARRASGGRTRPSAYDSLIREAAARHDLEYALVKAVIRAESDFDHLAVSPKGASGLMQLMPATAADHAVRNVFLPRENVEAGCRYLRSLLDRYGQDVRRALAAYNAGPRRVDEWRGVPPFAETREYLDRVLGYRLAYLREERGKVPGALSRRGAAAAPRS